MSISLSQATPGLRSENSSLKKNKSGLSISEDRQKMNLGLAGSSFRGEDSDNEGNGSYRARGESH